MAVGDKYRAMHARSLQDPERFWAEQAEKIAWSKRWSQVLDRSNPPFYRWFKGGELNACHNALDRHVESGRADQLALIYDSPVANSQQKFTYRQMRDRVVQMLHALSLVTTIEGAAGGGEQLGGSHRAQRIGREVAPAAVRRLGPPRELDRVAVRATGGEGGPEDTGMSGGGALPAAGPRSREVDRCRRRGR